MIDAIVARDVHLDLEFEVTSIVVKANLPPTILVAPVVLDCRVTQIRIALLENVVILAQINVRLAVVMCLMIGLSQALLSVLLLLLPHLLELCFVAVVRQELRDVQLMAVRL
jgi:hypothetical protein